jgi:selenophosphate synthase
MIACTTQLNTPGPALAALTGVHAITDDTGFGLAGHVLEMARGKGVRLQRYKDGGICDARVFAMADGLTWKDSAGRNFTVHKAELLEWIGARAEAGRLPPKGFPKNNRFG